MSWYPSGLKGFKYGGAGNEKRFRSKGGTGGWGVQKKISIEELKDALEGLNQRAEEVGRWKRNPDSPKPKAGLGFSKPRRVVKGRSYTLGS